MATGAADLWDSAADDEPGLLLHEQKVVAQKYSVLLFISGKEGEELLQEEPKLEGERTERSAEGYCGVLLTSQVLQRSQEAENKTLSGREGMRDT